MGSAAVLFLDGPLAGRTRELQTYGSSDEPGPHFYVREAPAADWLARERDPHDSLLDPPTVAYRIKRNRLSYGPKWVGAVGEKVGEQLVTVLPYDQRARESVGADKFDEYITDHAYRAAQRHAAAEGLVAVEVHEVWRGTRAEAAEQMAREGKPVPGASALSSVVVDTMLASTVFVVHEAVAVPRDQAREVVLT
ncbi:hypothetical protein PBI_VALIDUS_94 [Mycobacterium phage Validus]|uniref:Uncharacterized protein n=1 Tax=Mycobacterium phage Validus TaxID=1414747 RepID=V5UP78_9CAUD|nr:hypothetical protein CC50_gp017 [Mycobacterium phage Validus]AHB79624.1 hypothetical protein PBI_VALIDUS_94 [Mycobacterium phage Validus]